MWSLYKLELRTVIKSPSMMMPLLFPVILSFFYSTLLVTSNNPSGGIDAQLGFIILLSMGALSSGIMGFGFRFMNMKNSVLLRRIGASKITKSEVLGAIVLASITVLFIQFTWDSIIWTFLSAIHFGNFNGNTIDFSWAALNFKYLIPGISLLILASYSMGIFIVSIGKNTEQYQAIAILYFSSSMFLSGLMIPTLAEHDVWTHYIGWFLSVSWAMDFMRHGIEGSGDVYSLWLDVLMIVFYTSLFSGLAVKFLEWD